MGSMRAFSSVFEMVIFKKLLYRELFMLPYDVGKYLIALSGGIKKIEIGFQIREEGRKMEGKRKDEK